MKYQLLIFASLLVSIAGAQENKFNLRWVLAHEPARVFERSAKFFAAEVEKASKGKIQVQIITADSLPNKKAIPPSKAFDMVKSGEYEMCQTYTTYLGHQSKDLWVLDLPFLFRDHQHASKILDGPVGAKLLASLDTKGVKGLAFTYSGGYRIIPTKQKPIEKITDFQGMKIRVSDSPVAAAYLTALGAKPVPQVSEESVLEKGIDGFETTYARLENVHDHKSQYLNETEHTLFLTSIIMNKEFYEKLPQDLQKIVKDVIIKTAQMEREESIQDGQKARDAYVKQGLTLRHLQDSDRKKMIEVAHKVQSKYKNYFSPGLVSSIVNEK